MATLLPFGTPWRVEGGLRDRADREREVFHAWVEGLDVPVEQATVLFELLDIADDREFVEGRAACVTHEAEIARRTGLGESVEGVLNGLESAGLITNHPAAEVFEDRRPGVVVRVRRPDVVLTVEAAGTLWLGDSWLRTPGIYRPGS